MKIDEIDRAILKNLLMDGRISARSLSLKVGVSTVTIISRMKKLEKEKVITGYSVMLDHEKLGYTLTAVIEATAGNDTITKIEKEISKNENVCAVYDVTGGSDVMIIAKFKGRNDLNEFVKNLAAIPNLHSTNTHMVLETPKEDFRLT